MHVLRVKIARSKKKKKKSQDEVSLGPRPGDAIEMSVSTRAFERW